MMFVGLIDDFVRLKPSAKLMSQIAGRLRVPGRRPALVLVRLAGGGHPHLDLLGRRHHQRVQSARQHGRPLRRHRRHRRAGLCRLHRRVGAGDGDGGHRAGWAARRGSSSSTSILRRSSWATPAACFIGVTLAGLSQAVPHRDTMGLLSALALPVLLLLIPLFDTTVCDAVAHALGAQGVGRRPGSHVAPPGGARVSGVEGRPAAVHVRDRRRGYGFRAEPIVVRGSVAAHRRADDRAGPARRAARPCQRVRRRGLRPAARPAIHAAAHRLHIQAAGLRAAAGPRAGGLCVLRGVRAALRRGASGLSTTSRSWRRCRS